MSIFFMTQNDMSKLDDQAKEMLEIYSGQMCAERHFRNKSTGEYKSFYAFDIEPYRIREIEEYLTNRLNRQPE